MEKTWYLYMIRCGDGTLYTGITDDVQRRFAMHQNGKGVKYTRGRGPLTLVYQIECGSRSEELKAEIRVKALKKQEKIMLYEGRITI